MDINLNKALTLYKCKVCNWFEHAYKMPSWFANSQCCTRCYNHLVEWQKVYGYNFPILNAGQRK